MKFSASLALIVFVGLVACSNALPARKRMAYYQQPSQRYYSRPQRLMYMQYVQPSNGNGRSAQAASALVAGESVATGTYLQENQYGDAGNAASFSAEAQHDEDAQIAAGAHSAHSVAEAYPDDQKISVKVDLNAADKEESDHDAKDAREYSYDAPADVEVTLTGQVAGADVGYGAGVDTGAGADASESGTVTVGISGAADSAVPAVNGGAKGGVGVSVNLPAPVPLAPTAPKPVSRYLPSKKKVFVELEQSAEAAESDADNAVAVQEDEDVDEDDVDFAPVPVAPKYPALAPSGRRPAAKKPAKGNCAGCAKDNCAGCAKAAKPQPSGTFFPVEFGGTAGGAIAIANSFSTGEGGSATSHAIAYGSPDQARARVPARRRH